MLNNKTLRQSTIFLAIAILFCLGCDKNTDNILPVQLKTEYKVNPVIDIEIPRFSWILTSKGKNKFQSAYQIIVASSPNLLDEPSTVDIWNSGLVESSSNNQIEYEGKPLESRQTYYWKVQAWDENGNAGEWSETASFEMGLLSRSEWQADWIAHDLTHLGKRGEYHLPPAPYLRNEITLKDKPVSARLYVTALGVYDFYINGNKVGDQVLAPGWTNYNKRVYYHTFDVNDMLSKGENALGSVLSYGWYAGYIGFAKLIGFQPEKAYYGEVPKLKAQLEITYGNGEQEIFTTNNNWKGTKGALLVSDILNGETYDARLEPTGWKKTGFNDSNWKKVEAFKGPEIEVQAHPAEPIRYTAELKPKTITPQDDGSYIFDMGQNFAGVVTLKVKGKKGQKITLKFGEMLYPDGRLMTENLRKALCTDIYILRGDEDGEIWTPQFTFHGFQFVQIFGLSEEPTLETITGKVIGSDLEKVSSFECSDPMVNQLYSNIYWTQRANFIDIPTDCPQRDERLGWTGDAQVYISSAILNDNVPAFFTKWIVDLNDDQHEDGTYPNYAPECYLARNMKFSPGWMEAGIICPYNIFKSYGDTRMIEQHWENMEKFMDFHIQRAGDKYFHEEASFEDTHPKGGFSDWLSVGTKTAPELLTSMYFAYCTQLMSEMAEATGKTERSRFYSELNGKIKNAIETHYWDNETKQLKCNAEAYGDGKGYVDGERGFTGHTQTAYANAIYMDILNEENTKHAYKNLADLIIENDTLLSTGFLGVKQLLPAISEGGRSDLAYTLLLNKRYPSWGFEIENGATSIWERWNSYTKEDGFAAGMNSFSHYSFGSVYEWMIQNMAGIKNDSVAYRHITIEPELDHRISYTKASYNSLNGLIKSDWKKTTDGYTFDVTVPVNSVARVILPSRPNNLNKREIRDIQTSNDKTIIEVGSGDYQFIIKN